jgi:hypothetical protein
MHPKRLEHPDAKPPKAGAPAIRLLVSKAWDAGWWCERAGSGHIKCYPIDQSKPMVVMSSSPSDHRGIKNIRRYLRQSGLNL